MSLTLQPSPAAPEIGSAIQAALGRIPPLWPLQHFIAVNPFLGLADRTFGDACALLQRTTGAAPLQRAEDYRAAYRAGRIQVSDIEACARPDWTVAELVACLDQPDDANASGPIATVADLLDAELPRAHWASFVTEEVSKSCAVYFDRNQTTWQAPGRDRSLFQAWREEAEVDRNPEAFGLRGFRAFVRSLPVEADEAISRTLEQILPPAHDRADFLHRQLVTISGWAAYVQYLVREDAMRGRSNSALRDLLAIRLAYDAALFSAFSSDPVFRANWRNQRPPATDRRRIDALTRWQLAYERGYQRQLATALTLRTSRPASERPRFQAVFCIDVRSEILRRHLESAAPGLQTIGFAGFFGFPVAHQRSHSLNATAHCPALLVPPLQTDEPVDAAAKRKGSAALAGAWTAFQYSAASCFSFVESVGLGYAAALGKGRTAAPTCARVTPSLPAGLSVAARADLAGGALRAMSLTRNFARLVLICGHGSQSANNPHASSLDCGACGGHAGDVNAQLAAATLNDPAVRDELNARGIRIPADTLFVAALHNTMTDEVEVFEADAVPISHHTELATLQSALAQAGAATRRERAPSLGLAAASDETLLAALHRRASDIAEIRPEWGLANNAAFVAAPRSRTAQLKLDGRVFLHDYDAVADVGDKILTTILSAPVVVASWINLQYYASRVDPERYGAGTKVLHNVAGGIGVMEGNGGDLKVGLPLQSVHDGERFIHEPRRLTVFIDAPRSRIGSVLAAQPDVRRLFDNGWIHLVALEGQRAHLYVEGEWTPLTPSLTEPVN